MTTGFKTRVIKRYANRKLYDTSTKKYTTLGEIAGLIRLDEVVMVVENTTKRDITRKTLAEIFHQQVLDGSNRIDETDLLELIKMPLVAVEGTLSEGPTASK